MPSSITVIILGILQGITEFFPISSSGHLVIGKKILGLQTQDISLEVILHLGTFFSVVFFFHKEIIQIFKGTFSRLFNKTGTDTNTGWNKAEFIILASLPAAAVGLAFQGFFEKMFSQVGWVSIFFILTGIFLWFTKFIQPSEKNLDWKKALAVGVAQAVAILPGISRSGATIGTGLFLGLKKKTAAEFSFLLSLPAVLGANLLEAPKISLGVQTLGWEIYLLGFGVSFISGYLAIKYLILILLRGKFQYFGYYCIFIGILTWFLL